MDEKKTLLDRAVAVFDEAIVASLDEGRMRAFGLDEASIAGSNELASVLSQLREQVIHHASQKKSEDDLRYMAGLLASMSWQFLNVPDLPEDDPDWVPAGLGNIIVITATQAILAVTRQDPQ